MFFGTFWALIPPVIAIGLALVIKEPHSSLFIGAFLGSFLAAGMNPLKTMDIFVYDGILTAVSENAGVITFVVTLGIVILLVNLNGGAEAFGKLARKHIHSQTGAMLAAMILGLLIFIDDMFNCFTVGAVMKPVTDRYRISRQKLAYILDATAAPICMIAPVSSWGAAVSSTAEGLGTGISGIELFVRAIPYNFYSLFTLVFLAAISLLNFDYGKMKEYRKAAEEDSNGQETEKLSSEQEEHSNAIIWDLILPVAVMIGVCSYAMLRVGGFFDPSSGCFHHLAAALGNTDGTRALPWGGMISLIFTVLYSLIRKTVTFRQAMDCAAKSFINMASPLLILILAVSLKNMTTALGAAEYIHFLMQGAAGNLYRMLPSVIFLVACLLSFASGTSWGTFGILIPIVTAIFPADSRLMIIGISACLAGAVCGDHCSPISDTTIMSSAAAECDHVSHVETQLPYALTVAAVSFLTYILAGFCQNAPVCLAAGSLFTVFVLLLLRKITAEDQKSHLRS